MDFGVYISSMNIKQFAALSDFISENKENSFFAYGNLNEKKIDIKNTEILKNKEEFCKKIVEVDALVYLGSDEIVNDEAIINNFLSSKIKPIYYLDTEGETNEKSTQIKKADLLFIFPGSILPLNLGSHQRSFNLIYQLKKIGINVDLLIAAPKNMQLDKLKNTLSYFCNNVYFYENNKKKFSKLITAKRFSEKYIKKILGKNADLPDLFSERLTIKPNESCKKWVNSLYISNNYKHIIVSYAWMLPCLDYIKHDRINFDLICDTHDVQFIRNRNLFKDKERLGVSSIFEKKLEIDLLNSCNSIIAISIADEKILKENLNSKVKIVRASAGFNYALLPVKSRPLREPFRFGFIGGKMDANVKSLEFIIDQWWPKIKEFSPESKFFIAGSICNHPYIFNKIFLEKNIVRLGFVDSLVDFYNKIDISLNPVLIQGGLNFKSVEAVFAGKHLATNPLGMECLGNEFPAIEVNKPDDLINYISKFEFEFELDKEIRVSNQVKAMEMFDNKALETVLIQKMFNYI